MMKNFSAGPSFDGTTESASFKKEIFWGCESGNRNKFPLDMGTISLRHSSADPKPMNAFRSAFMTAEERIWIVDPYFLIPERGLPPDSRIVTILDWMHDRLAATDIRILTAEQKEVDESLIQFFQIREDELNVLNPRRHKRCSIQVNRRLKVNFKYLHDRFAIVDDELWHFGATVGGFHSEVNAASRGWSAVDSGAIEFFELVWKRCEGR